MLEIQEQQNPLPIEGYMFLSDAFWDTPFPFSNGYRLVVSAFTHFFLCCSGLIGGKLVMSLL